MSRVAWLTCALLALAYGRIYERCELARDLQALGVNSEDLATWVCIAYHESRFDTAANNPYSGDHGIFQISELFWCGPGKACGLSCSALRDDDISNDFDCALQIHEEHTRLQGNGFLAWVVYPLHCKHNTKKYLVDCDTSLKSSVPITKSRVFGYEEKYYPKVNFTTNNNVDDLLPPYLTIAKILRGDYGKVLHREEERFDWQNYKIHNIDDLRLPPLYVAPEQPVTELTTTTTTTQTTTDTYIRPPKPWRTIETNQFRKKQQSDDTSISKETPDNEYVPEMKIPNLQESTAYQTTSTQSTTQRPITISTTTEAPRTTLTKSFPTTTFRPYTTRTSTATTRAHRTTTARPTTNVSQMPFEISTQRRRPTTTNKPFTFTSRAPIISTAKTTTAVSTQWTPFSTSTTNSWFTKSSRTTERVNTTKWTTARPYTAFSFSLNPSTTTRRTYETTTKPSATRKSKTESWYTFTSRTATTAATKSQSSKQTTTLRPYTLAPTTFISQTSSTTKPKSYESIFDLYLNPTMRPKIYLHNFDSQPASKSRIRIFSDRTTTPAPNLNKRTTSETSNKYSGNATKNQVKRQNGDSNE